MNFVRFPLIVLLLLALTPLGPLTSAIARSYPGLPVVPIERIAMPQVQTSATSETTPTKRCNRGSAYWLSCALDKNFRQIQPITVAVISPTRPNDDISATISRLWESRIFRPPRLI